MDERRDDSLIVGSCRFFWGEIDRPIELKQFVMVPVSVSVGEEQRRRKKFVSKNIIVATTREALSDDESPSSSKHTEPQLHTRMPMPGVLVSSV